MSQTESIRTILSKRRTDHQRRNKLIIAFFVYLFCTLTLVGFGVTLLAISNQAKALQSCPLPSAPTVINTQIIINPDVTDGIVDCSAADVIVGSTGELIIGKHTIENGTVIDDYGVTLLVKNLTIQPGGKVNANGQGYTNTQYESGIGRPGITIANTGGPGAGHGGGGGVGIEEVGKPSPVPGSAYGSNENAVTLGTAGGNVATDVLTGQKTWTSNADFNSGFFSNGMFYPASGNELRVKPGDNSLGNGADGSVTFSSNINLNVDNSNGRTCADGGDGVNYNVSTLSSSSADLTSSPSSGCLNLGDEVLLINLQGTFGNNANVGNYETFRVNGVTGSTISFDHGKSKYYGSGVSDDNDIGTAVSQQRVILQRIPNYVDVTIDGGANLTVNPWDGVKGGVLFFKSNGVLNVNGTIDLNGKGYRGGQGLTGGDNYRQGESYTGLGAASTSANGGAGGVGTGEGEVYNGTSASGGGGASYGTAGDDGVLAPLTTQGSHGNTYGTSNLSKLYLGSGGGGGGAIPFGAGGGTYGGNGGNGGAIAFITASTFNVSGVVNNNGSSGNNGNTNGGYGGAGGGGGSGGSTYIVGSGVNLGSSLINAIGGTSGLAGGGGENGTNGGAGGNGIIAVGYVSVTGTTNPVSSNSSVNFSVVSGEQSWTSNTYDAGSGVQYNINKITSNWVLDSDAIKPKFQIFGSNTGSFSGEEAIYPAGIDTYYQNGGTYNIDSGVAKDTTGEIPSFYRYWKVKAFIDAGATLTDTPRILDIKLDANTNGTLVATGGNGGGAIKLVITETLTNDGTISADGSDGTGTATTSGGGGSGGSIWIESGSLAGSGTIHANGGTSAAATYRGGGGGGGRMIVYCTASSTYNGTATVAGGVVPGAQNGGVGTILGPTCRPTDPTILTQYKLDNSTNIPLNGITTDSGVTLAGNLTDPDSSDLLSLQVEVRPLGTVFTNIPNYTQSSALSNPQDCLSPLTDCGKVSATGLVLSKEYHWQARVKDNHGGFSNWVSFGANGESSRDFLIAGPGRNIIYTSGSAQTGTVFTSLTSPLVVNVTDVNGFPVPNYGVTWSIVNGQNGGTLTDSVTYTNNSGQTSNTYKLGRASGGNTIQATGGGLTGSPVSFSFTGTPDVINHFTVQAPQVAITNEDLTSVTVKAYDQYNNIKVDYTGTPTLSAVLALSTSTPGSGILSPSIISFTGGDNGVKVLNNVNYNVQESIKLKVTDGSSEGVSSTIAVVDTLGACPDADGIIDTNQTWAADGSNFGVFDCTGINIHITSGAILTLTSYDNGDTDWTNDYGVTILADNFQVDTGSTVNADASGYTTARGPGPTANSVYEPNGLGSASNGPLSGGGAIKLTISGLTQIEGTITANGGGGTGCHQGGSMGGSIWIDTATLKGAGLFRTNGGNGVCNAGGGAGGRIAVYYTTNGDGFGGDNPFSLTSNAHIQSFGGPGDWCGAGCNAGAGTIYIEHMGTDISHEGILIVDNANSAASAAYLPEAGYVFKQITLTRFGNLTILGDSSSLNINDGNALSGDATKPSLNIEGTFIAPSTLTYDGVDVGIKGELNLGGNNSTSTLSIGNSIAAGLTLYAHTWAHTNGSYTLGDITVGGFGSIKMVSYDDGDGDFTNDFGVDLYASNLNILAGGSVNADLQGFSAGRGIGTDNGAAHGGTGGYGNANTYGSVYEPHELGSGGAGGAVNPAGGAMKITVSGLTQIDGRLSVNGGSGLGCHAGGSSAGSIWLDTNTIKGSGVVSSDGGNGSCAGSGGAGGRVAIYYTTNGDGLGGDNPFDFTDRNHIHAQGGAADWYGAPYHAGAGTVYVEHRTVDDFHAGRLYVDNVNYSAGTAQLQPGNYQFKEINLTRAGNLKILGDTSILTIIGGSDLTGDATRPSLNVLGIFVGPSALNINGVTLSINGEITLGVDNSTSSIILGDTVAAGLQLYGHTWAHTNGQYTFGDITVSTYGVLSLAGYDNGDGDWTNDNGVSLQINNLDVQTGGSVSSDSLGYTANRGTGTGNGAGYGGFGGYGAVPYGSVYQPSLLGSGGTSLAGGGSIKLTVSNLLTLNGTITSDGGSGVGCHNGGASGGSIWIDTENLSGAGLIKSNGGGGVCAGAGGSGGRIAIYYTQNGDGLGGGNPLTFSNATHVQAFGGPGDWGGESLRGGAGTVYVEQKTVDNPQEGSLFVDNNNHSNLSAGLAVGIYTFKEITLTRAGNLTMLGNSSVMNISNSNSVVGDSTKPNLVIEGTVNTPSTLDLNGITLVIKGEFDLGVDNSTSTINIGGANPAGLTLYSNTWSINNGSYTFGDVNVNANGTLTSVGYDNGDSNWTNDFGSNIHANNFIVQAGGYVSADGQGYPGSRGPGTGNGGSYGGITAGSTVVYGSVYQPVDLGSGSYHEGGGAIKLTVSNIIQIDGTISVNGLGPTGCHQGGASGGSIYIDANIIKGSGLVRSNGANGSCSGVGGSGGRIAVYYIQNGDGLGGDNTFAITDRTHIQSFGGPAEWCGVTCNAGAGTVYVEHKGVDTVNQGSLYIDNANSVANAAGLTEGTYVFKEINLTRYGNLNVTGDNSILTVTNGNNLTGDSTNPNLTVFGTFNGPSTLTITGVTLGINGDIKLGSNNATSSLTIGGTSAGGLSLYGHTWAALNGSYTLGDVTVANSGILNTIGYDNGDTNWTNDNGVNLHVNNLYVETGGYVNADRLGYAAARGPGTLGSDASYGGHGLASGTSPYGSIYNPTDLGSGGGIAGGGGAVKVTANHSVLINGIISSNGGMVGGGCQGGSSGGSILVDTDIVSGTGVVRADGGNSHCAGGGSGGRIALLFNQNGISGSNLIDWTNTTMVHALGGQGDCGVNCNAGPGTVYAEDKTLVASNRGDLVIDNNGVIGANGMDFDAADYYFNNVKIGNNVKLLMKGDLNALSTGQAYPSLPSPSDVVSGLDPLALWHLDEQYGSGSYLTDSSGNGHSLSPSGGSTIAGYLGNARDESASNNALLVSNPVLLPTNWTISTWLHFPLPVTTDGWRTVTSHSGGNFHQIIIDITGLLGSYHAGFFSTGYNINSLSTGWHNIVAVADSGSTKFYVDSNLVGTIGTVVSSDIGSICNYNSPGGQQCGSIDETAVYGRAITGPEVSALYSSYQSNQSDFNTQFSAAVPFIVGRGVVLNLTGNFTLGAGSTLDGKLQGFASDQGPGKGTAGLGLSGGGGAGHGGAGGTGQSDGGNPAPSGGVAYGSQRTPLDIGSGGGPSGPGTVGGFGGGAIAIRARYGVVDIAGGSSIDVSGESGHVASPGGGGGAGGSILIEGATCSINGNLNASGGNGGSSSFDGGGAGGGRISILYSVGPCDTSGGILSVAEGSSVQGQSGQIGTSPAVTSIPAVPTIKQQFESDGTTIIPAGGFTAQNQVVLKANVSDPGADGLHPKHLRAQFEVVPFGDVFAASVSSDNLAAASVEAADLTFSGGSPVLAQVPIAGLTKGESYKWRTRIVNVDDNIASDWINFTNSPTVAAFSVSTVSSVEVTVNTNNPVVGQPITVTVTAKDSFGNPDSTYTGTIHFTSSSPSAILPADYQFSPSDHGVKIFTDAITFTESGSYTITITDTLDSGLTYTTPTPIVVEDSASPETPVSAPVSPDDCEANPSSLACLANVEITNVEFKKIDETTVEICWNTNVPAKGYVDYGLTSDGVYTNSTPAENAYTTVHCVTVSNLEAGQTYNFRVNSIAESSKINSTQYSYSLATGETGSVGETTDFIEVTEKPYAFNSDAEAILKYITVEDATCKVDYGLDSDNLNNSTDISSGTNHSSIIDLNNADGVRDIYYRINCQSTSTNKIYKVTGIIPASQYKPYLRVKTETVAGQEALKVFANIISPTTLSLSFGFILLLNFLIYPRFILFFLGLLRDPKKYSPWGIVYDAKTKKPVAFASVRIYSMNGDIKTFIKEKITNLSGKYGLPVSEGKYMLEVRHPDYANYSIELSIEEKEVSVSKDVGLESKETVSVQNGNNVKTKFKKYLRKINTFIVVLGFFIAIVAAIISPVFINILLVLIYLVQFIVFYLLSKNPRNWGYLYDAKGNGRVQGGFVRVYSIKEGRQVDVQMSDESGRFGFELEEGTYGVAANVPGYKFPASNAFGNYIKNDEGLEYLQVNLQNGGVLNEGIPLDKSGDIGKPTEGFGS